MRHLLLALLLTTGCKIYGYARDHGVKERDHYDANHGGRAEVRDVWSETRIRDSRPKGSLYVAEMDLRVSAGPSAARREGAQTIAYATGHREFSFVPEETGVYVLTVDVEREARHAEQVQSAASLRWYATLVDDRTGTMAINLFNDPERPRPGPREGHAVLDKGAPYRLVVHAWTKADTTRTGAAACGVTDPRAAAEVVFRARLHRPSRRGPHAADLAAGH